MKVPFRYWTEGSAGIGGTSIGSHADPSAETAAASYAFINHPKSVASGKPADTWLTSACTQSRPSSVAQTDADLDVSKTLMTIPSGLPASATESSLAVGS